MNYMEAHFCQEYKKIDETLCMITIKNSPGWSNYDISGYNFEILIQI